MKGYIKIQNDGEIDVNAFLLLGASTKRGDEDKIGYFGSGLKYAISVLLRNQIPFYVFSGEKEIKITTVKEEFRGQEFQVIKINNKKTSLTTHMGPDWEPWFSIREIYCNALDEQSSSISTAQGVVGESGKTTFYISFDEKITDLFKNWNRYFSNKREDVVLDDVINGTKVLDGSSDEFIVYRKGVQCYTENQKSLYHYDLAWVEINESRVLKSHWDFTYALSKMWGKIATTQMIKNFFDNYHSTFEERSLQWDMCHHFNKNWLDVINGRTLVRYETAGYFAEEIASGDTLVLPDKLVNALKDFFRDKVSVLGASDRFETGFELQATERQLQYIEDAKTFLNKADIDVNYPIVVWKFNQKETLGEARNGQVRLSPEVFSLGKRQIVMTLLEELGHLETGFADKTRSFQNYLFDKLLFLLEEKTGERL